jgi:hypothetical protein
MNQSMNEDRNNFAAETKPQGPGDVGKMIDDIAAKYMKSGMSKAQAYEKASMSKEVIAAHRAEVDKKVDAYAAMHTAKEYGPGRNALASTV